jgi:RHS repeat-associated protein
MLQLIRTAPSVSSYYYSGPIVIEAYTPPPPSCNITNSIINYTHSTCGQNNGSITINGAGAPSGQYEYSINGSNWYSGNSFSNLSPGTYRASVRDPNNINCAGYADITINNTGSAPSTPSYLDASDANCGSISLTWEAVSGATSYNISRNGNFLRTVYSNSSTDNAPPAGVVNYSVEAVNGCGTSGLVSDNGSMIVVPSCPIPDGLQASASSTSANVSWNSTSDALSYTVFWQVANSNNWQNSLTVNGTSYTIANLQTNTSYQWYVKANCNCGIQSPAPSSFTTEFTTCITPTISNISDFVACIGSNVAIFRPSVSDATFYQWYKNGLRLSSQRSRSLQFNSGVTASDAGRYYLTASNGSCTTTSNTATLSLSPSPDAAFTASTGVAGQSMSFTVNPNHNATSFAWTLVRKSDNSTISTGTGSTWNYTFPHAGDDYKLTLAASNSCATTTGGMDPIRVNVNGSVSLPAYLSYNVTYVADPINSATGVYTYNHSIMSVQGIRSNLNFNLHYQSDLANINRTIGYGFRHSFDTYMSFENGYWVVNFSNGRKEEFAHYSTSNAGVPLYSIIKNTIVQNANGTFTYKSLDETVTYLFAANGTLQSITDVYNNVTAFTYNGLLLTRVTAPGGRYIAFTYSNGLIQTATDNSGRTATFTYTNNDLTRITNTRTGLFNFTYQNHLITDIYDPLNIHFIHNVYDAQNRVIQQDLADGSRYTMAYNTTTAGYKMVTTVTDALNRTRVYYYNADFLKIRETDELGNSVNIGYNDNKYVNSFTNERNKTITFDTDANGNVIGTHFAPLNRHTSATFNAKNRPTNILNALNVNLSIGYDANGNPLRIDFPNSGNAQLTYTATGLPLTGKDAMNRNTSYAYNAQGDLVQINTPTGAIVMTYDAIGRLLTATNQLNKTIAMTYDAWGNITQITDAMQHTIVLTYDANGNLLTARDKNNHTISFGYDNMDRLLRITNPMNNGTMTYAYDLMGNVTSVTYPNGAVTTYTYDAKYRLLTSTNLLGTTRYQYDASSNVVKIILPNTGEINITYNDANEPMTVTDVMGTVSTVTRNALGFVVSATDGMNRTSTYTFNNMNQLTTVNQSNMATVGLGLNLNGELTAVTDPNQHTNTTTLDAAGRPTAVLDAANHTYTTTFDNANQVTGGTDARGIAFTITRNDNSEITAIRWSNGESESYTLDAEGQPTLLSNQNGSWTMTRNANDQILSVDGPFANDQTAYTRNNVGLATTILYEQGKSVTNAFNGFGMPTGVSAWANVAVNTAYNSLGAPLTRTFGSALTETNTYNLRGDLLTKTYTKTGGTVLFQQTIARNLVGEPTQNAVTPFIMPNLALADQSLTYAANDAQANSPFTSDANGNLLTFPNGVGQVVTATFDGKNRIITLLYGSTQLTNTYDVGNFLIAQTINGITKRYVWDYANGLPHIIRETDANGVTTASYIWSGGILVARIANDNTVAYYLHDAYGNVVALADATGAVTDRYAYGPNGEAMNHSVGNASQPFTWLGAYGILHQTGNLFYIRQRWYDAGNGRFLSQDEYPADAVMSQSLNRYIYGVNMPMQRRDITGLFATFNGNENIHYNITLAALKQNGDSEKSNLGTDILDGVTNVDLWGITSDYHFDGRPDFTNIETTWADLRTSINTSIANIGSWNMKYGGTDVSTFGNLLHTVQDFYSHSNYIELYQQYYATLHKEKDCKHQLSADEIPLYKNGVAIQDFKDNYLVPYLRTGDFEFSKKAGAKGCGDTILCDENSHEGLHHDTADRPNHSLARAVATRHTAIIIGMLKKAKQ